MPPRSPLPQRNGLDPAWVRTPDRTSQRPHSEPWSTMREWLTSKLSHVINVDQYIAESRFVTQTGRAVAVTDPYKPHTFIWFYRELRDEAVVPGEIHILHRDERIIVIDKPPFLSTIPRGRHVTQSVTTILRDRLQLPELTPAHRLDRVTSGVLLLVTERQWRGAYQSMFQARQVHRTYHALARTLPDLEFPQEVHNHLLKISGEHTVRVVPNAEPNAHSKIEVGEVLGDLTRYQLTPMSGKTHQLRQHMFSIGAPIEGDPLYPLDLRVEPDDFSTPLQLLANRIEFVDPITQLPREFTSKRSLPLVAEKRADASDVN